MQEFAEHMKNHYLRDNEINFRNGISSKMFTGINCDDDYKRDKLLHALRAAGINEVNGVPIEKFVKVKKEIGT